MTTEQREKRSEKLRRPRPPRTREHAQRISDSLQARRDAGLGYDLAERQCRGCPQVFAPKSPAHWWCDPQCQRKSKLVSRYGITRAQYAAMLQEQDGRCAVCGGLPKGYSSVPGLHIDHCHQTNRPRALLCGDCNTAIGRFGDDPERLRRAADYLERYLD